MGTNENFLDELVEVVFKEKASDLHIAEGRVPVIRVSNFLIPLVKMPVMSKEDMNTLLSKFLTPEEKKEFDTRKEINFAYSHNGSETAGAQSYRFRCNAFLSLGKTSIAMRLVPTNIKSFAELNL